MQTMPAREHPAVRTEGWAFKCSPRAGPNHLPPARGPAYSGRMKIHRRGHACLIVEMAGTRILIDPGNFSDLDDLGAIDAVIITHNHADHFDPQRAPELLASLGAPIFADPKTADVLAQHGIDTTVTAEGDQHVIGPVTLTPVGSQHAFNHEHTEVIPNVGAVLSAAGEPTLFHPGDAYDAEPGPVDVLAVPVNAPWTPVRDTIDFVRRIRPRHAFAIHDALLSPQGRDMYGKHTADFGQAGEFTYLAPDETGEYFPA